MRYVITNNPVAILIIKEYSGTFFRSNTDIDATMQITDMRLKEFIIFLPPFKHHFCFTNQKPIL